MRVRLSALLLAALAGSISVVMVVPAAHALDLAQDTGGDEGEITETDEEQADTGAGGDGATEEEGPPWTYQMSWMSLVLVALVGLMIGLLYYRMIVKRQKEGL